MKPFDFDELIGRFVGEYFPRAVAPDKSNRKSDGRMHKAPDHDLVDIPIYIERKTIARANRRSDYRKLLDILKEQGVEARAYGEVSAKNIISLAKDKVGANRKFIDYSLNIIKKTMAYANKQFLEHIGNGANKRYVKILIITDTSEGRAGSDSIEYFIGRNMKKSTSVDGFMAQLMLLFI